VYLQIIASMICSYLFLLLRKVIFIIMLKGVLNINSPYKNVSYKIIDKILNKHLSNTHRYPSSLKFNFKICISIFVPIKYISSLKCISRANQICITSLIKLVLMRQIPNIQ